MRHWVELEYGKIVAPQRYHGRPIQWEWRSSNQAVFSRDAPPAPRLFLVSAGLLHCHYEFEVVLPLQYSSPKSNIYATIRQEVHTTTHCVTSGTNSVMHYGRLKTQILLDLHHNPPSVYNRVEDRLNVS